MALAILDQLALDLDRLVIAGALAARGDGALARHQTALAAMGASVPALARTAELIAALRAAPVERAGIELLQLNAAVQQLRATQLGPGAAAGELAPFPAGRPASASTAMPIRELYALVDAMASKKKPSAPVEAALRDPSLAGDPRLWQALVDALGHPYLRDAAVGQLGAVGPAILPLLEAAFRKKGSSVDAARLRAIGAIRGAAGEPLYRECMSTGSREVREAAFDCLAAHAPAQAETAALAAFDQATDDEARLATLRALVVVGSDATLDRVIALADRGHAVPCARALEAHLGDASMERLTAALARHAPADPEAPSFGASGELIRALTRRHVSGGGAPAIEALARLLRDGRRDIRVAAAHALLEHQSPAAWRPLAEVGLHDGALYQPALQALFALGQDVAYDALAPYLPVAAEVPAAAPGAGSLLGKVRSLFGRASTPAAPPSSVDPRFAIAVSLLSRDSDPRFFEPVAALLDVDHKLAVAGLANLGDRRAIPLALAMVRPPWSEKVRYAIYLLGKLRASEAGEALARWLGEPAAKDSTLVITTALTEARAISAIPALERLVASSRITKNQKDHLTSALTELHQYAKEAT